jgi:broad specificity polyphosphatase/5'/3'-nucleotidase SurE
MSNKKLDKHDDKKFLEILLEHEERLINKLQDERKRLEENSSINFSEHTNVVDIKEIHEVIQAHRFKKDNLKQRIKERDEYYITAKNSERK